MPTLFVLRHAKSSSAEEGQPDRDRPLAERGRRAAGVMAGHLGDARIAPDVVLCSVAARAQETLSLVGAGFPSPPEVRLDDRLYGGDATEVMELLRGLSPAIESVMVIGHNPTLQDLVVTLAAEGELRDQAAHTYPSGALATLAIDGPWDELGPGRASLAAFVKPKQLER